MKVNSDERVTGRVGNREIVRYCRIPTSKAQMHERCISQSPELDARVGSDDLNNVKPPRGDPITVALVLHSWETTRVRIVAADKQVWLSEILTDAAGAQNQTAVQVLAGDGLIREACSYDQNGLRIRGYMRARSRHHRRRQTHLAKPHSIEPSNTDPQALAGYTCNLYMVLKVNAVLSKNWLLRCLMRAKLARPRPLQGHIRTVFKPLLAREGAGALGCSK
ncbi:hypothetical protein PENSPDRAFT_664721 [Peniophora sp. CONT]|nr:hypothetical protein PENSPDRAFT_664721 [Peniophora sp. CONT]